MIFFAVFAFIVTIATTLIVAATKKKWGAEVIGATVVATLFASIIGAFLTTGLPMDMDPNQINNHKAKLQSLVEQAGGKGGKTYVRMDYVNRSTPDQVVTFASKGKLQKVDGSQVVIRTVASVKDARVVRQEYFSHYPLVVPWYSAGEFQDRYVLYVPKDAIEYGTTDQPLETDEDE